MRHKLRLEALNVQSFETGDAAAPLGTVHGHQDGVEGTFLSMCRSCGGTCDEHTCNTCPPQHTCGNTCPPLHTCVSPVDPVPVDPVPVDPVEPVVPGVNNNGWAVAC